VLEDIGSLDILDEGVPLGDAGIGDDVVEVVDTWPVASLMASKADCSTLASYLTTMALASY
jgi:hypothetical protein